MDREQFFTTFAEFLRTTRSKHDLSDLRPDTHLWESGLIDSITMIEVLAFLEYLRGCEIDLRGDFLAGFFTMESIYETHIRPLSGARSGEG